MMCILWSVGIGGDLTQRNKHFEDAKKNITGQQCCGSGMFIPDPGSATLLDSLLMWKPSCICRLNCTHVETEAEFLDVSGLKLVFNVYIVYGYHKSANSQDYAQKS